MDIITIVLILIAGVILFTILKSFFKALLFVILIILVYYGLMYFIDGSVESIQSSLRIFHLTMVCTMVFLVESIELI